MESPDFTDAERWLVETTLKERYSRPVTTQLADVELRLDPAMPELTPFPALFWKEDDVGFVISKVGNGRFRCQFFYSVREQYGIGRDEFDDLLDCAVSLLKFQASHAASRQKQ